MHQLPHSPRHDAMFGLRIVWEHRDELEKVSVWIAKEYRGGRHPREDNGLLRWSAIEVKRCDASGA
jgi:hypothetical protein